LKNVVSEMKITIGNLPGDWREAAAAYTRGTEFPRPDQVVIEKFERLDANNVDLIGTSEGKPIPYSIPAGDKKTAEKVRAIVENNLGISLLALCLIEIPKD